MSPPPENHGWFDAKFPEHDGALLSASAIFELRALAPLAELAEGRLAVDAA